MRSAKSSELIPRPRPPSGRAPTARCGRVHRRPLHPPSGRRTRAGRRQDHAALGVELDLERAGEEEAREGSGSSVGIALLRRLVRPAAAMPDWGRWPGSCPASGRRCAPGASSARKRAGTATRPFASMECRNSPVNTPLPRGLPSRGGVGHHPGVLSLPVGSVPTLSPHFAPLWATSRHLTSRRATSSPF